MKKQIILFWYSLETILSFELGVFQVLYVFYNKRKLGIKYVFFIFFIFYNIKQVLKKE